MDHRETQAAAQALRKMEEYGMTRRKKILVLCGGIIVVLIANVFLLCHVYLSPGNIRKMITDIAREQLGCAAEIDAVNASLLGLVELKGIRLSLPGPEHEAFLTVDRAVLDCSPLRLVWGKGGIDELEVSKPRIRLSNELVAFFKERAPSAEKMDYSRLPRKISLRAGTMTLDAGFLYEGSPEIELSDLQLNVQATSYSASQLTFNGSAKEDCIGSVRVAGAADLLSGAFSLTIESPQVQLNGKLRSLLPKSALRTWDDLGVTGQTGITVKVSSLEAGKPLTQQIIATPTNCSVRVKHFPLPFTQVSGVVESDGKTVTVKHAIGRYKDGTVEVIRGFVDKDVTEFETIARSLPLTEEVRKSLPQSVQSVWAKFNIAGGAADVLYRLKIHKNNGKIFPEHYLDLTIRDVAARFEDFPYPVERLRGRLTWETPRQFENGPAHVDISCRGIAGDGIVKLDGRIPVPPPVRQEGSVEYANSSDGPDLTIEARRIALDDRLRKAVPPEVLDVIETFTPVGNMDATILLKLKHDGRNAVITSETVVLHLNGIRATFRDFPYPVTNLAGQVEWDGSTVKLIGLNGLCDEARVTIAGELDLQEKATGKKRGTIAVTVEGLKLDTQLYEVLDDKLRKVWNELAPSGKADVVVLLGLDGDGKVETKKTTFSLDHCSAKYKGFPYLLESLTGKVIVENGLVTLESVTGCVPGRETEVTISGQFSILEGDQRTHRILIKAERLWLDEALRTALSKESKAIWDEFDPSGRVNALCIVEFDPAHPNGVMHSMALELDHCKATYERFPYPLESIIGRLNVDEHAIVLENVIGFAGIGQVRLTGKILRAEGSNDPAENSTLAIYASDIDFDTALVQAMPASWAAIWDKFTRKGSFGGKLNMVFPAEGEMKIAEGSFLSIRNFSLKGIPLPEATFSLKMDDELVYITDLSGAYFGGRLEGNVSLGRTDDGWSANIKLYGIDIKQINDEYSFLEKDVRGRLTATIELRGKGEDTALLEGKATVDINNGWLADIPLLADAVMSLLSLGLPKGNSITDAEIECEIGGGKIHFEKIVLTGTSVPITGDGTIKLDGGELDLTFVTSKDKKTFLSILPFLGPLLDKQVISKLRNFIIQVRIEGTVQNPKRPTSVPLSGIVTAPIKLLLRLIKGSPDDDAKDDAKQPHTKKTLNLEP